MACLKERFAARMKLARIADIIDSSMVDGPGNRTVVFFQGCNFKCIYCHNPETIPTSGGRLVSIDEVIERIKRNMPFIVGITASGGECTLQAEFLTALFNETHMLGLTNFIDTNGALPLADLPELVKLTDGFMLDIKSTDKTENKKITGKDNSAVLLNACYLASIGKLYEIRTVALSGTFDTERTIREIALHLGQYADLSRICYKIIRLRKKGVLAESEDLSIPTEEELKNLKYVAIQNGFEKVLIV